MLLISASNSRLNETRILGRIIDIYCSGIRWKLIEIDDGVYAPGILFIRSLKSSFFLIFFEISVFSNPLPLLFNLI